VQNLRKLRDKFNISKFAFFLKHDTIESYHILKNNFPSSHFGTHFNNFNTDNLNKIRGKSLNFHSGFDSKYFHLNSINKIMKFGPSSIENLNYSSDRSNKLLHLINGTIRETLIYFTLNYFPMEGSIKDKGNRYFKDVIYEKTKKIFDCSENIVLGTHTDINPKVWIDVLKFLKTKYKLIFKF
jgi:hypothetical protein